MVTDADLVATTLTDDDYGVKKDLDGVSITQKGQTLIFGSSADSVYLDGFIRLIEGTDVTNVTANNLARRFNNSNFTGNVWATFKDGNATGVYVEVLDEPEVGEIAIEVDLDGKIFGQRNSVVNGKLMSDGSVVLSGITPRAAATQIGTISFEVSSAGKISNVTIALTNDTAVITGITIKTGATTNATVAVSNNEAGAVTNGTDVTTVAVADAEVNAEGKISGVEYASADLSAGDELPLVDDEGNQIGTVKNEGGTVSVVPEEGVEIAENATISDGASDKVLGTDGTVGEEVDGGEEFDATKVTLAESFEIEAGATEDNTITATVSDSYATFETTVTSSAEDVATATATSAGVITITAKKAGTANLTVTAKAADNEELTKEYTIAVTVSAVDFSGNTLSGDDLADDAISIDNSTAGATSEVTVTLAEGFEIKSVASGSEETATVENANGTLTVTAVADGEATITVTIAKTGSDPEQTSTLTFTVTVTGTST